ncbi:MAG: hypothetical protein EHM39_00755 [Chloroflexi bacterium]|nr:MAG: hypothetical protein EHM39_00755 [Chloroflexota bacterium]
MDQNPTHRLLTSYALTLFILGVTVVLLAIVGRVAQEFQHRLIIDTAFTPRRSTTGPTPLPPLITSIDEAGSRFVIGGFLVGLAALSSGGALWFLGGRHDIPSARIWTAHGSAIVFCLLLSMGAAVFVPGANLRLALMVAPSALALVLFMVLVYLVVEHTLLAR